MTRNSHFFHMYTVCKLISDSPVWKIVTLVFLLFCILVIARGYRVWDHVTTLWDILVTAKGTHNREIGRTKKTQRVKSIKVEVNMENYLA